MKLAMEFGSAGRRTFCTLVICLYAATRVQALTCYKCTTSPPAKHSNETERLCSNFDPTHPRYRVNCPYSTFCMKKSIELSLPGGKTVRSAIRDCAPQKYDFQAYSKQSGWTMEHSVEDSAYQAGCHSGPQQANVHTPADQYCYCRDNLCNAAKPTHEPASHHTDAMAVIFVFNAMKYVRSLR